MKTSKLETLMEVEGYDTEEELCADFVLASTVPGICMNSGCDYTTEVEPDQCAGWCAECGTGSVMSAIELLFF